jgi:hypothetical protein
MAGFESLNAPPFTHWWYEEAYHHHHQHHKAKHLALHAMRKQTGEIKMCFGIGAIRLNRLFAYWSYRSFNP